MLGIEPRAWDISIELYPQAEKRKFEFALV
jgi:hypothetical protein